MAVKYHAFDSGLLEKFLDEESCKIILKELRGYDELSIKERYIFVEIYNYRLHDSIDNLCNGFDVSRSGYYYWKEHQNDKYEKDKPLIDAIREIQTDPDVDFTYGVLMMKLTLEYKYSNLLKNGTISKGKVRRLMKENRLEYRYPKKRGYNASNNVYPSLLTKSIADIVGERIGTDTSEKKSLDNEKLYISVAQDSASSYLLSWKISKRMNFDFIDKTIREAKSKINKYNNGTIIHSDQGVHYKSSQYKILCTELGLNPSMSRKATPTDNGQTENIFSCLVKERLSRYKYKNLNELAIAINEYFIYYNNKRIHTRLKMTPRDYFELHYKK